MKDSLQLWCCKQSMYRAVSVSRKVNVQVRALAFVQWNNTCLHCQILAHFIQKRQCPAGPKQTDNFGEGMITTCCCTVFVEEGMITTCCCTIFVEVYVIPITTHMILKIPWGTYARLPIQSCGSDPDIISEVPGKI